MADHPLEYLVLGFLPTDPAQFQASLHQEHSLDPSRAVVQVDLRIDASPHRAFALLFPEAVSWATVRHQLQSSFANFSPADHQWWGPECTESAVAPTLAWVMPGSGALGTDFYGQLGTLDPLVAATRLEAEEYFAKFTGQTISLLELGNDADSIQPLYQRPATVTATVVMARLLQKFGLTPDLVAGHSVGELTACHLAGCFSFAELIRLTTAPFVQGNLAAGAMAALMGSEDTVLKLVQQSAGQVMISNRNSPQQVVISGTTAAVDTLVSQAKAQRVKAIPLKVATAYHSPALEYPHQHYRVALAETQFQPARVPVVSGLTADVLPWSTTNHAQTRALLDCAFIGPVNHVGQIQRLSELGAKVFVDLGPTSKHVRLVKETLKDEHTFVALGANPNKTPGRQGLLECLAQLHILGYKIT